jgi:hypothetical protein
MVMNILRRGRVARGLAAGLTISCCDHSQDGMVAGRGYKIA